MSSDFESSESSESSAPSDRGRAIRTRINQIIWLPVICLVVYALPFLIILMDELVLKTY